LGGGEGFWLCAVGGGEIRLKARNVAAGTEVPGGTGDRARLPGDPPGSPLHAVVEDGKPARPGSIPNSREEFVECAKQPVDFPVAAG